MTARAEVQRFDRLLYLTKGAIPFLAERIEENTEPEAFAVKLAAAIKAFEQALSGEPSGEN